MSKRTKPPAHCYWRGGVLWGRIQVKGTPHRFSLRTSDAKLAAARLKAKRELANAAAHFGEIRMSYQEAFIAWAAWIAPQVGPKTAQRYAVSLGQIEQDLAPLYIDQISKRTIGEIIARRQKTCAIATVRRDLTALSSLLSYCEAEGWCEANYALAWLRRLRERRNPIVRPAAADIAAVCQRAPGMLAAMMAAALATGAREDELAGARSANIDHARKQLTVIGKGNKLRVIDLAPMGGYEILKALPPFLGSPFLFWHGAGLPYRNVASRFTALIKREHLAQLAQDPATPFRRFRFHDLRHEHAIRWLKEGRNIYDLQHRLGHASIKTTELYLEHLTAEEARAVKYGAG